MLTNHVVDFLRCPGVDRVIIMESIDEYVRGHGQVSC